jgi:DMSO reductase anchor subunit
MCPYEVPHYSPSRGIVRKCDMCQARLAAGEAPACVQACPNQAITITVVPLDARPSFPPDTPDPGLTRPTTRYASARGLPADLEAGDRYQLAPAPAHLPLVVMLTLTQLAVGVFVALAAAGGMLDPAVRRRLATGALAALVAGMAASVFHLGRPAKAWRAFLGLGTSWMSREVVAFGALVPLALAFVGSLWLGSRPPALAALVAAVGVASVACSVMIYDATGREFWRAARTGPQLLGTTALLGAAALLAGAVSSAAVAGLVAALAVGKLAVGIELLRHRRAPGWTPLKRSALLLAGPLRRVGVLRVAALGLVVPAAILTVLGASPFAGAALGCALVGELAERWLFFVAVAPTRMPGAR